MIQKQFRQIFSELTTVLSKVKQAEVELFIKEIIKAKRIVTLGAGRMGFVSQAFAMRLSHLGKTAYFYQDSNTPHLNKGDLLVVNSGSGETESIYRLSLRAKETGAHLVLVSAKPQSRIGLLADLVVKVEAPVKTDTKPKVKSKQPMTTLNEQALGLFYDALVLELMAATKQTEADLWRRHTILE
jgi:6-phospho-3-hexuloisomerase